MKKSDENKIMGKLDEVIELANDREMIKRYPTFALEDLIKEEFKEITSMLPPSQDTDMKKNT